jgi:hypothetical protein
MSPRLGHNCICLPLKTLLLKCKLRKISFITVRQIFFSATLKTAKVMAVPHWFPKLVWKVNFGMSVYCHLAEPVAAKIKTKLKKKLLTFLVGLIHRRSGWWPLSRLAASSAEFSASRTFPESASWVLKIIVKLVSWFKSSLLLRIQSDSITNINS